MIDKFMFPIGDEDRKKLIEAVEAVKAGKKRLSGIKIRTKAGSFVEFIFTDVEEVKSNSGKSKEEIK